jgi:hypothetical protein
VPVDQGIIDQVIQHYGPRLAEAFIRQIAGGASRLDLSDFAVALRQFIKRDSHAPNWIQTALATNVPEDKVDKDAQRIFLQQIGM